MDEYMKVAGISGNRDFGKGSSDPVQRSSKLFSEALTRIKARRESIDLFKPLSLPDYLLRYKDLSTVELLRYQISAGEYRLGIEMVSRIADSALTTVRRLQNAQ